MQNCDKSLIVCSQKSSKATEAFRGLRTNLFFLKSKNSEKPLIITATSVKSGEGKTVISSNTAFLLAQSKYKTLLVDADMRKPSVHEIFGLKPSCGLTAILEGSKRFEECVQQSDLPELDILTNEYKDVDPTELLLSKRFKELINEVAVKYDFVIFDTPPMYSLADTNLIATHSSGVLFVVSEGNVTLKELRNAKKNLESIGTNILGIVYNKSNTLGQDYGDYYYTRQQERKKL